MCVCLPGDLWFKMSKNFKLSEAPITQSLLWPTWTSKQFAHTDGRTDFFLENPFLSEGPQPYPPPSCPTASPRTSAKSLGDRMILLATGLMPGSCRRRVELTLGHGKLVDPLSSMLHEEEVRPGTFVPKKVGTRNDRASHGTTLHGQFHCFIRDNFFLTWQPNHKQKVFLELLEAISTTVRVRSPKWEEQNVKNENLLPMSAVPSAVLSGSLQQARHRRQKVCFRYCSRFTCGIKLVCLKGLSFFESYSTLLDCSLLLSLAKIQTFSFAHAASNS